MSAVQYEGDREQRAEPRHVPRPPAEDWAAYDRVMRWLRLSGWREAFAEAMRRGDSLDDARDYADRKAAQTMREEA